MTQNKTQNQKHKKIATPEPTGNKDTSQFRPQLKKIVDLDTGQNFVTLTSVILQPNSTIYIHAPDGKLICKVNASRGITVKSGVDVHREKKIYNLSEFNCFENEGEIIFPSQG